MKLRNSNSNIKVTEQRIDCADFVKPHFVDQFFEDQRLIGEKIDSPLPIIESDRTGNNLPNVPGISAADKSMFTHLAGPFLDRELVPVLVFTAAPVHRIKACIPVWWNVGVKTWLHRFSVALKLAFNLGFPLVGMRLNALISQFLINLQGRVIKAQFDDGKVACRLFQVVTETQVGQFEFRFDSNPQKSRGNESASSLPCAQ